MGAFLVFLCDFILGSIQLDVASSGETHAAVSSSVRVRRVRVCAGKLMCSLQSSPGKVCSQVLQGSDVCASYHAANTLKYAVSKAQYR